MIMPETKKNRQAQPPSATTGGVDGVNSMNGKNLTTATAYITAAANNMRENKTQAPIADHGSPKKTLQREKNTPSGLHPNGIPTGFPTPHETLGRPQQ